MHLLVKKSCSFGDTFGPETDQFRFIVLPTKRAAVINAGLPTQHADLDFPL